MPAHLTAYVLLARAYESRRRWGEALRAWKSAHLLMPTSPLVREGRERVLDRLDEIPEPDVDAPAGPSAPDGNGRAVVSAEQTMADALASARAPAGRAGDEAPDEDRGAEDRGAEGPEAEGPEAEGPEAEARDEAGDEMGDQFADEGGDEGLDEEVELPTDLDALDEAREALNLPTPGDADAPAENEPPEPARPENEPSAEGPPEETPGQKAGDEAGSEAGDEAGSEATASDGASALPSDLDDLRDRAEREARQGGARPGLRRRSSGDAGGPGLGGRAEGAGDDAGQGGDGSDGDLDRLIEELESARIDPSGIDPAPEPEAGEEASEPDLEGGAREMVSETLARIYANQDRYREASRIYVKLAARDPERIREYLEKAASMREEAERRAAEAAGGPAEGEA
jgi:hypothetical protein